MSYCTKCGADLSDETMKYCPNCGSNLISGSNQSNTSARPAATAPAQAGNAKKRSPEAAPLGLDKATFLKNFSQGKQQCVAAAIMGYIGAGVTFILSFTNFLEFFSLYSLIDVIILVTLSLLIHLLRSRIASSLLLAYALYNFIFMLVVYGKVSGWLIIIAGVFAVIGSFKCVTEWKAYQARNQAGIPI